MAIALPEGRQGKALAVAVTLLGLAIIWFALAAPLIAWHESRAAVLAGRQAVAAHMEALVRETPQLRAAVAATGAQSQDQQILLAGSSDAIAGANLQSALQNLASQAGTNLDSAEVLPAQAQGALRRIEIQVSVNASWPVLIRFLQAISTARPRMLVSQLNIVNSSQDAGGDPAAQADFTVAAFSAGSP